MGWGIVMDFSEDNNPCDFCKGRVIGEDGQIFTCDDCPIIKEQSKGVEGEKCEVYTWSNCPMCGEARCAESECGCFKKKEDGK